MSTPTAERLVEEVTKILHKRIQDGTLILPAPPLVVTKVLSLTRDPAFNPKDATSLIERDERIAARVLKAANSVQNAGVERVKNLQQALTRLGVEKLKAVLVEVSAAQLFMSRDQRIQEVSRGLWEHSVGVAMLTRDVAALCSCPEPDTAYLAGLLHDVGKAAVAWLLLEAERSISGVRTQSWLEPEVWLTVVQQTHKPVGLELAQKWGLPEAVIQTMQDMGEYNTEERTSAANCVRFANAMAKKEGLYVGTVDQDDIEAMVMIGRSLLGVDEEIVNRLATSLTGRVKQLAA